MLNAQRELRAKQARHGKEGREEKEAHRP